MTLDTALGILNLALALAGLKIDRPRLRSLLFACLIFLAVLMVANGIVHNRRLRVVQTRIVSLVSKRNLSEEDIYAEIQLKDRALVREALSKCLDNGTINFQMEELLKEDGTRTKVDLYSSYVSQ
jgi:hypothetical protein